MSQGRVKLKQDIRLLTVIGSKNPVEFSRFEVTSIRNQIYADIQILDRTLKVYSFFFFFLLKGNLGYSA